MIIVRRILNEYLNSNSQNLSLAIKTLEKKVER